MRVMCQGRYRGEQCRKVLGDYSDGVYRLIHKDRMLSLRVMPGQVMSVRCERCGTVNEFDLAAETFPCA